MNRPIFEKRLLSKVKEDFSKKSLFFLSISLFFIPSPFTQFYFSIIVFSIAEGAWWDNKDTKIGYEINFAILLQTQATKSID